MPSKNTLCPHIVAMRWQDQSAVQPDSHPEMLHHQLLSTAWPDTTKPTNQVTLQKADTLIICLMVYHYYISLLSSTLTQILRLSGFGATGCDPEPLLDQYKITVVQSAGLQAASASLWFNTAHMLSLVQSAGLSNTFAVMTSESDITRKGTSTS